MSQNYGYTLIDTPNGFTIFISKELLIAYIRKRIETCTDVRLDDNDIYALLSSIYEDSSLPMPFLLDLHARINEDFVPRNFDFAKSLVNRFLALPYSEQQRYSKLKLRPIYKALGHIKEYGLDEYLNGALDSENFNIHKFLSSLIEDAEFSQDINAFVSIFGEAGVSFCNKIKDTKELSSDEQQK